jgi:hypothetical protein
MNIKHERFLDHTSRKCVDSWTLDNNYRVKVRTYHDKVKKAYWSVISECIVEASGTSGFYFEKHTMHTDLNQLAGKVEALRFNGDSMVKAHDSAIYSVRELIDQLLQANQAREKVSA